MDLEILVLEILGLGILVLEILGLEILVLEILVLENLKYLRLVKNTQVLEYLSMDLLMEYEKQHLKVLGDQGNHLRA